MLQAQQESIPFWRFTIERLMEFPVEQRILFYWKDGSATERFVKAGDDISFVGACISEHGEETPHDGLAALEKITIQLPTGVDGWSKPAQIWPDPQPLEKH